MTDKKLSHVTAQGKMKMVDVSEKTHTLRIAIAAGKVVVNPQTLTMIEHNLNKKGDVLTVAQLAGIMGAKRTAEMIPLCHPIQLTHIDVELKTDTKNHCIHIQSRVQCIGQTGVEMEALTAVAISALTVYDMIKAVDRTACIEDIHLMEKHGGKSGDFFVEGKA